MTKIKRGPGPRAILETTGFSRRSLLAGTAALGGLSLLPGQGGASTGSRIVIIGAGLSGLYAALELQAQGHEVVMLEARQRPGGRVKTLDDVAGHPEGGANIMGPNYGRILRMAQQFDVGLRPPPRGFGTGLVLGGQRVDRETWADSEFNTLPAALKAVTPDRLGSTLLRENPLQASDDWRSAGKAAYDQAATDFYRAQGLDERALDWIDANNSYGNVLEETSMLSLFRVGANIRRAMAMRQPVYEAVNGNLRVPEAMAGALKEPPRFGEQVTLVERVRDGSYQVHCQSGLLVHGDAVICTVPLPALRQIRFTPAIPEDQLAAINHVEYHQVTQAHFVATEPYWEAGNQPAGWWTDGPLGRVFTRSSEPGVYNLTCWINGADCSRYDALNPDDARQRLQDDFLTLVPESRGKVELKAVVSWAQDPLAGGSWAIWKPGQIGKFANLLSRPHGRVFFAGEHTSWSNSGMEGAAESGERVALEALRALS